MLFLTFWCASYLAIVFPLYWAVRAPSLRLLCLLAASAVFHTHFAGPAGVTPIIILAALTYLAGLTRRRAACYPVLALNVGALVFYKYTRFLCAELLARLVPGSQVWLAESHPELFSLTAPLAISFFVFEFVHYLVDVSRGSQPVRRVTDFALYAIFWPSIVAGPVKRYQEFLPALHRGLREVGEADVAFGLCRVALGLVKKFVADNLAAYVTATAPVFCGQDLLTKWWFVAAISLRILWDFSGYSDLAIGFARMHGIVLPENFNWPYLAASLPDFWRRWHISLSSWIRDYVYIALGGGRCGLGRKVGNGLVAFGLCGLWHGAGWNFLFWGLYHGAGLAVASSYRAVLGRAGEALARKLEAHRQIAWVLTMIHVGIGWLFFFYPLSTAVRMTSHLFWWS
jgi:alginate O-acetyltransferase complex protein AlgI